MASVLRSGKVQWGKGKPATMVKIKLTHSTDGWRCDEFHGQPWIWSDEVSGQTIEDANIPQATPILAVRRFLRTWDRYGSTYVKPGSISTVALNLILD